MITLENDSFLVSALGPNEAKFYEHSLSNWSLKNLQMPIDAESNRPLANAISNVFEILNVTQAWAPSVASANATIIDCKDLIHGISLKGHRMLYRNPDVPADGIFLERGGTFVMSSAGCPLIVATAGDEMITAHAGIHSLVDEAMYTSQTPRQHESVVFSIIEALMRSVDNLEPKDIKMWVLFSIPTPAFTYRFGSSQYGMRNRLFINALKANYPECVIERQHDNCAQIDLETLIMMQTAKKDVTNVFISDSLSKHPELTHTRKGTDYKKRNLIVVRRKQNAP